MQPLDLDTAKRQLDELLKCEHHQHRDHDSHPETQSPSLSARSVSSELGWSLDEEQEFKAKRAERDRSFNTRRILERANEIAQDGYCDFRLRRPLERLRHFDRDLSRVLGILKQRLEGCPSESRAALIEDRAQPADPLEMLRQVEMDLQQQVGCA